MRLGRIRLKFFSGIVLMLMFMLSGMAVYAEGGGTWTVKASMYDTSAGHQVAVVNGKIYVIGGNNERDYHDSVLVYDPSANIWGSRVIMANERVYHQVAIVNGKIYAIGGYNALYNTYLNSMEEYDPATNRWSTKASMADKRSSYQVAVVNGKIYAIGGHNGVGNLNSVEEYDPTANRWTTKASMSVKRTNFQVAIVNEKIYVIGGYDATNYVNTNSVEEYDPTTNTWTTKAPMADKRIYHQVAVVNGKIYAIGGNNNETGSLNSVEEYNPAVNIWTTKASMVDKRHSHQMVVVNEKIYAIGGYNGASVLNSLEEYDPATNTWIAKAVMIDKRVSHQVAEVDGKIYAIGGYDGTNYLNSVEEYTPVKTATAPDNLTATAGNVEVNLSWTPITGTTVYNVKKATTAGGPYTTIAPNITASTYTDTAVINGTTYYYVVTAIKEGVESVPSDEASATPRLPLAGTPTNLAASPGNSRIALTWQTVPEATSYNVKRAETSDGPYITIASRIAAASYADTAVANGTTYYYVVSAINASGESANSNEAYATPQLTLPGTPANLMASPGNLRIDLAWQGVSGVTSYNVKRSETSGCPYTTIATNVTTTSYTDTTVANNVTYYYIVTVVTEGVESPPSNEASATPTDHGVTLSLQSVDRAEIGDIITVDVVINNAVNICAEDFRFDFDTNLLEFMGSTATDGMKLYRETYVTGTANTYRDVLSCLGRDNAANGSKVLLHLKFKAKQAGQARIDILKGRIADNATLETDISAEDCGEKVIIVGGSRDVNRSGEFTLLDLGIDAWYYGSAESETDTENYDADLDSNGLIDDVDLAQVVAAMLANENYGANV